MTHAMTSSALALLHNLESAQRGEQLPKHVAGELEEQGLAVQRGGSPGDVELTPAGQARLQGLLDERSESDGVQP
jgi:hypothetical protein